MQTTQSRYYRVDDVMAMMQVKETKAYAIIRELNNELKEKGKIVINGRVPKKYFDERIYGDET